MRLRCPHCQKRGEHARSDFLGDWVVCAACRLPFTWRPANGPDAETDTEPAAAIAETTNSSDDS
jgi:hypothetical protein